LVGFVKKADDTEKYQRPVLWNEIRKFLIIKWLVAIKRRGGVVVKESYDLWKKKPMWISSVKRVEGYNEFA